MLLLRGLVISSQLLWRRVQAYSSELSKRCRPHLKRTNKSYRVDETYIKVRGHDKYLYRAVDSTGQTIDFLLSAKRDTAAAKRFFEKVFSSDANPIPRVINVDKNPAYPAAVKVLVQTSNTLGLDGDNGRHDRWDNGTESLQGSAFRPPDHRAVCALVSQV